MNALSKATDPNNPQDNHQVIDITKHIEGHCTFNEMDLELRVHANDTVERMSAQASFTVEPKFTITLILEGDLEAAIDGHSVVMSARNGPTGYLWLNTNEAKFDRMIRSGQKVRKVTLSLPLDKCLKIFDMAVLYQALGLSKDSKQFAILNWQPTAQTLRYAEEIFLLQQDEYGLKRLESYIAALSLLQQAFSYCTSNSNQTPQLHVNTRDAGRARQARAFVLDHIDENLSIDIVAKNTGMSVSTLQRIFKATFGCTVMEFVRIRKLELARLALLDNGISVGEAAFQAGYSNTANFSTAFQREFGYPPSSCIQR